MNTKISTSSKSVTKKKKKKRHRRKKKSKKNAKLSVYMEDPHQCDTHSQLPQTDTVHNQYDNKSNSLESTPCSDNRTIQQTHGISLGGEVERPSIVNVPSQSASTTCTSASSGSSNSAEFSQSGRICHQEERLQPIHLPGLEKYVAVDCEFVGIGPRGRKSGLARCSIVDFNGNVVLDMYIRPEGKITDYRTPYSGIRPFHMKSAIPYRIARNTIRKILNGKIIVGHSIHNDFKVLRYFPPSQFVRDTASYKRLRVMAGFDVGSPVSLKRLSFSLLGECIQKRGHCSVEDARCTMRLFRLVRQEWEEALFTGKLKVAVNKKDNSVTTELNANRTRTSSLRSSCSESEDCYLQDNFWPKDLHQ